MVKEKEQNTETVSYGYYSKLLNKPFDTLDELQTAEEEVKKAELAKKQEANARKEDAGKVEDAYKAFNTAKKQYNESAREAKKLYFEAVSEAKKTYTDTIAKIDDELEAAEKKYNDALEEFTKAHGNFHLTLKDGDNVTTISHNENKMDFDNYWSDFINNFFKMF